MRPTDNEQPKAAPFWCSIRVAVAFIGFLGMIAHYSQKISVGIALVCMVNHSAIAYQYSSVAIPLTQADIDCPSLNNSIKIEGPFPWTKNIQGIILGGYFWGYLITEIPGGYLAGRYGARYIFGGAMIIAGSFSIAMPLGARLHWGVLWFLRLVVGLAHGVIWPCMAVIMSHWAPQSERGKLLGFMNAGAQIGNVLTLSLGGLMCSWRFAGGWPLIFYSTGILGLVWGIFWIFFYADSPRDQRCVSKQEKEYILRGTQAQLSNHSKNEFEAPWKAILTSRACWALFVIHTCNNWGTYTFLTSIPKYMAEVLRFDIKSNGFLSALPYLIFWLNINISGAIADLVFQKKLLTKTQTRNVFNVLGNLVPAIFVIGLAFMTCELKYVAVALLTIGVTFTGCCYGGGFLLTANDLAPDYSGIIFGISNTFATLPGIISPYIVGALTEKDPNNWRYVFFICAVIYIIGMVVFLFMGSGDEQPWAVKSPQNPPLPEQIPLTMVLGDEQIPEVKSLFNTTLSEEVPLTMGSGVEQPSVVKSINYPTLPEQVPLSMGSNDKQPSTVKYTINPFPPEHVPLAMGSGDEHPSVVKSTDNPILPEQVPLTMSSGDEQPSTVKSTSNPFFPEQVPLTMGPGDEQSSAVKSTTNPSLPEEPPLSETTATPAPKKLDAQ